MKKDFKLNDILESSYYVSELSKNVTIDYDMINEVVKKGIFFGEKHWLESNPFSILSLDIQDLVQLLLVYHSVGFCYWREPKWEIYIDNHLYDGGFAMLGLLVNRFKKNNSKLLEKEFRSLVDSKNEIPLLDERLENLKLIEYDFYEKIQNLTTDVELFNYIINKYDYFNDFANYEGTEVYFYKLAQLLVSDILHIRKYKENIEVDYSNLVGCADYKISQVLNCYGILKYSESLENKINNKEELGFLSKEEIEIRANTLVVINEIYIKLNETSIRIDINDLIWLMGQDKSKMNKNYHRVYTRFY